jgi:hypothetical protein
VVLAGVFTEGSLKQLRSHGFTVLYFPYESVVAAFAAAGIDAAFDEDTPDAVLLRKVKRYERLTHTERQRIPVFLRHRHKAELDAFTAALRGTMMRRIESIYILPLHGSPRMLSSVPEAIAFIESFDESKPNGPFTRYEVGVRYTNGDEVRAQFKDKATAIAFLREMK